MAENHIIKEAEAVDSDTDKASPLSAGGKRLRLPLNSIRDVRRELARVYRDMRSNKINASQGTKLAFVLFSLGRLIEQSEFERRISTLEKKHGIN